MRNRRMSAMASQVITFHEETGNRKNDIVASTWTPERNRCFLKIIPVRVAGPKKEIDTYAPLDDSSTVTLIDSDLAQQIGARGRNEPLHIEAIAKTKVEMKTSRRVPIKLRGASNSQQIYARTIENLQLSPQAVTKRDIDGCKHLNDIRHKLMYDQAKPKILIGQDSWHLLVAIETRTQKPAGGLTNTVRLGPARIRTRTIGQRVHYVYNKNSNNGR
ncbi:hypothetical protein EVAR_98426_1 [Eumeta japonica]|uniref:Uncharacterized protein n=1 Tax=Eumeta variegata TaxID=151549 RepID=A0A4C2A609_EUMVA|nr:hypothetical protein EVAR_98426_1 [Eumeta japonica]